MNSPHSFIEQYPKKSGSISIRPYMEGKSNMGLEKYAMALFENVYHEEPLICLEQNGVRRYLTGLNEFAPEVKNIPDEEERQSVIKRIRHTVSDLERELNSNVVDPEDPAFWSKIVLLHPNNDKYWSKIKLKMGNEPMFLDPAKDPEDLIKVIAIEAGGFSLVAKSMEDGRKRAVPVKFYLDKFEKTATVRTEGKKLRNKAGAELEKLFANNINKLRLVVKMLSLSSVQFKNSTPHDVLYQEMDKFIDGESYEKNKEKAARAFISATELDMETLKLRAIVKDATAYKQIATRSDGFIYHLPTSSLLGKNQSDVVEYLRNPLNEQMLQTLTEYVERQWNA